jgi:hypothetical protein
MSVVVTTSVYVRGVCVGICSNLVSCSSNFVFMQHAHPADVCNSRDSLESDGSRQRWYQRNLFSNWRSKSPAPSPGPAKSALSEQLQCSSSDSAVVAVPPLAAAVVDPASFASAPEPSTLLDGGLDVVPDTGLDIGLDIGDQGTSVAGMGNGSGHPLGAATPTAIPVRTGPASVGAEDSGYSPDADATPTGAEPGASFPTEEALKAAPKEAMPGYPLSVASEVTDLSVEDSEADSEAESERGVSGQGGRGSIGESGAVVTGAESLEAVAEAAAAAAAKGLHAVAEAEAARGMAAVAAVAEVNSPPLSLDSPSLVLDSPHLALHSPPLALKSPLLAPDPPPLALHSPIWH